MNSVIQSTSKTRENIAVPPKKQRNARLSYEQLEQAELRQSQSQLTDTGITDSGNKNAKDDAGEQTVVDSCEEESSHVYPISVSDELNYGIVYILFCNVNFYLLIHCTVELSG